jgi:carboxymethylenebutenolidase
MADIIFTVGPDELRAYLAVPEGEGPWPGVVVLHDAFGLTQDMRDQADRFAAEGYVALAPDLYSAGPRLRCVRQSFRDLLTRRGRSFDYIEGARAWLAARDESTGRVGLIGFCMGGGFALVAAARSDFFAVSANYGMVPPAKLLEGACPIVASYGGRDQSLRGAAAKLERRLSALGVPNDVKEYPGTGHSFLTDSRPGPVLRAVITIPLGLGQGTENAADGWRRIFAFFGEHVV